MRDPNQSLTDAFVRLGAVPLEPVLTRDEWVEKHQKISLKSLTAISPDSVTHALDTNWTIVRIGSFWFHDEECHVYAMDSAIRCMIENRHFQPDAVLVVVTPIWVFFRQNNSTALVGNADVLKIAEQNYMRFFDDIYRRWKQNG
jgi:hypothetical protein